jgi:hypothetical protein
MKKSELDELSPCIKKNKRIQSVKRNKFGYNLR